jgi:hypothetical protein
VCVQVCITRSKWRTNPLHSYHSAETARDKEVEQFRMCERNWTLDDSIIIPTRLRMVLVSQDDVGGKVDVYRERERLATTEMIRMRIG